MSDNSRKQLGAQFARGSTVGSIALAAGYLTQYLFQVSVSRTLGAEASGSLFFAIAGILLLATVARLGLDKTGLKIVSACYTDNRTGTIREVALLLALLAGIGSAIIMALLFFSRTSLSGLASLPDDETTLAILLVSIPVIALSLIFSEVLRGMRLVGLSSIIQLLAPYGIALTIIWGVHFLAGAEPRTAAMAVFSGFGFSALLGAWFIYTTTSRCQARVFSHYSTVTRGAPAMLWSALILFGISGGDIIILGYFVTGEEVAFYFAPSRTAMLISISLVGINSIVAPMIASAHKENNPGHLGHIARMGARLSLAIAVFFSGMLFICGEWVLSLFGKGFEGSFTILLVLLMGQLVNSAVGAVAFIMFMSGHERKAARILTIVISVMAASYIAVIPEYGIWGAALVTALGIATWNLGMMKSIHNNLGVTTCADNLLRCTVFLSVAGLVTFVASRINIPAHYLFMVYALVTPVILWRYVLLDDDRDALKSVVSRWHTA